LSAKLRRRVDPEDVVQSAFRSFFRRAEDGDYHFADSGDLWRLLTVITLNKLRRKAEYHSAGKRDFGAERDMAKDDPDAPRFEAAARGPSPEAELEAAEEIEITTQGLTPEYKRLIELRLQGYNLDEIATEIDCSERTVRRVLERFRQTLEDRLAGLTASQ
jgi:RNA polymerase sigma-70 factor (ECF subfamily)